MPIDNVSVPRIKPINSYILAVYVYNTQPHFALKTLSGKALQPAEE